MDDGQTTPDEDIQGSKCIEGEATSASDTSDRDAVSLGPFDWISCVRVCFAIDRRVKSQLRACRVAPIDRFRIGHSHWCGVSSLGSFYDRASCPG